MNFKPYETMKINIHYLLLSFFLLTACTETINWEVEESDARLVVEGRISTELKRHEILLTKTASYFSNKLPDRVSDATVTITDGSTIFDLTESDDKGVYLTQEMAGEIGKLYTLNIVLAKSIGEESQFSASSELRKVMQIDSMVVKLDTIEDFGTEDILWVLSYWGQETPIQKDAYQADILVNGKTILPTVNDYIVFNDFLIEDEYFEDYGLWAGDDIEEEDSVSLILYSVEDKYEDFIEAIFFEIDGPDELGFSGPPANVKGNISNGALGYFYATDISSYTTIARK